MLFMGKITIKSMVILHSYLCNKLPEGMISPISWDVQPLAMGNGVKSMIPGSITGQSKHIKAIRSHWVDPQDQRSIGQSWAPNILDG